MARPGKWSVWQFNWLAHHKRLRAIERVRDEMHGALLDVGCGSKPFAPLLRSRVSSYLGVDLPGSSAIVGPGPDAWALAEQLPVRTASVDTVLAMAMLSYLPEPRFMLVEAQRVLRPGGVVVIEFMQMGPPWNAPYDYWRFTRFGAELMLRQHGFEPLRCVPVGGLMARVGLSAIAGLNRINRGPLRILTEIPVRLLYVLIQLVFEGLDQVFAEPDECLANLIVARRL